MVRISLPLFCLVNFARNHSLCTQLIIRLSVNVTFKEDMGEAFEQKLSRENFGALIKSDSVSRTSFIPYQGGGGKTRASIITSDIFYSHSMSLIFTGHIFLCSVDCWQTRSLSISTIVVTLNSFVLSLKRRVRLGYCIHCGENLRAKVIEINVYNAQSKESLSLTWPCLIYFLIKLRNSKFVLKSL